MPPQKIQRWLKILFYIKKDLWPSQRKAFGKYKMPWYYALNVLLFCFSVPLLHLSRFQFEHLVFSTPIFLPVFIFNFALYFIISAPTTRRLFHVLSGLEIGLAAWEITVLSRKNSMLTFTLLNTIIINTNANEDHNRQVLDRTSLIRYHNAKKAEGSHCTTSYVVWQLTVTLLSELL